MSTATAAVRVCRLHDEDCKERGDSVICPRGHRVEEGAWKTETRRVTGPQRTDDRPPATAADLEGQALVLQRAQEAFRRGRGDVRTAVQELISEARVNPRIKAALVDPYLETAATEAIVQVASGRTHRGVDLAPRPDVSVAAPRPAPAARAATGGNPDRALVDGGLELLGQNNLRTLSAFVLPNSQPLAYASQKTVRDAALEMGLRVRGAAVQARWLALIARDRRMRGARNVAEALNEQELGELLGRAASDVARVIALAPRARLNASPLAAPRPQDN